ncbi:MAG TPA: hypothetical protein PL001_00110 [Candidatus Kryptobacter bacterium]|nr:hypothetical protein [Candidatus Kryptobacter bacterium]
MSQFITLHDVGDVEVSAFRISISSISRYGQDDQTGWLMLEDGMTRVKETPEEIDALIAEAEEDERTKRGQSDFGNVLKYVEKMRDMFPDLFPKPMPPIEVPSVKEQENEHEI